MKYIHILLLFLATLLVVCILGYTLWQAGDYYLQPLNQRPHHEAHQEWKPGGIGGHTLGIIGTLMILIMLIYTVRKRLRIFRRWGKLTSWLNYHIFLGITGPILITSHTALKFGGLVSVAYWSMIAVALSGFIGRYIYVKIPRHVNGEELTLQEVQTGLEALQRQLRQRYNLAANDFEKLEGIAGLGKIQKRGMAAVFTYLAMDLGRLLTLNRVIAPIVRRSGISGAERRRFRKLVHQQIQMSRRIAFLSTAQRLFHYWHVIHRPFAYTMIIIVAIHIYIVTLYGYRWIF